MITPPQTNVFQPEVWKENYFLKAKKLSEIIPILKSKIFSTEYQNLILSVMDHLKEHPEFNSSKIEGVKVNVPLFTKRLTRNEYVSSLKDHFEFLKEMNNKISDFSWLKLIGKFFTAGGLITYLCPYILAPLGIPCIDLPDSTLNLPSSEMIILIFGILILLFSYYRKRIYSLVKSEKKQSRKTNGTKATELRIWIIIISGLFLTILGLFFQTFLEQSQSILFEYITYFGRTLIAAGVVALILRLPSLLQDVDNSAINLLKNDSFLSKLSTPELRMYREKATEHSYRKTTNSVNSSLKDLDSKIADIFFETYFKYYKIEIECNLLENGTVEKIVTTTFELVNPLNVPKSIKPFLSTNVYMKKIPFLDDIKLRELVSLSYKIDDSKKMIPVNEKVFFEPHIISSKNKNDYIIKFCSIIDEDLGDQSFNQSLTVKSIEKRIIPAEDKIYTYRINMPTASFSITYWTSGKDIKFLGSGFGTFQSIINGGINEIKKPHHISIQFNDWLLTGNGVMIVHDICKEKQAIL